MRTRRCYSVDAFTKTIGDVFDGTVEKFASKEAIRYQGQGLTYEQLADKVESLAKALMELGVEPGQRVGIWMPNYPEWIYANLAIAKIGAVTVPINIRFKSREVAYILRNAEITALIMADQFLTNTFSDILYEISPELEKAKPGNLNLESLPHLKNIICLKEMPGMFGFDDIARMGHGLMLDQELKSRQRAVQPTDAVNVFYTSGTTGLPKGAMADHNILVNIENYIHWMNVTEEDVFLIPSPLFYTTANYWCTLCPIMAGATMSMATYFTLEEKLELISKDKVTFMVGMAKMWVDMVSYLREHPSDTSSLRIGWTGGGPITVEELEAVTKNIVGNIVGLYGMTETGGITTMTKREDPLEVLASTVGTPLPNFELKVIDPQTGEELPDGKPGELCVKGPYVIKGYLNMPEKDQDIYFEKDGWYHTQDIVLRHENGYYSFVGRIKDMIKVGGENVSLNEIDDFLRGHQKVKMACSIGVPDPAKQEVALVFIEPAEGVDLSEGEIIDYCKGKIASYKIPKYIRFTSDWPTTATGKIQRFKLSERVEGDFNS
jgi:fatty-acyl-CoA synthase